MRTTTDTYSHVLPALAQQAADTLDAALWGTGQGPADAKKHGKKQGRRRGRRRGKEEGQENCHHNCHHERRGPLDGCLKAQVTRVELRGLEPLTPTLPVWCATSCATAPWCSVQPTRLRAGGVQLAPVASPSSGPSPVLWRSRRQPRVGLDQRGPAGVAQRREPPPGRRVELHQLPGERAGRTAVGDGQQGALGGCVREDGRGRTRCHFHGALAADRPAVGRPARRRTRRASLPGPQAR